MKTDRSGAKVALERFYYIDREIAAGVYPNTADLARVLEVSTATVSRDIEFMRDRLRAPLAYDARRRGYCYEDAAYRLPAGFAQSSDMLALGMTKTLLAIFHDTPIYAAVKNLLDTITAPLKQLYSDSKSNAPEWYETRVIIPPQASVKVDETTWNTVITALRLNRELAFDYRGVWDTAFNPRFVRPYQLLFDAGTWYLYAWAVERKEIRIFALQRVRNAKVTANEFSLPSDFDYCSKVDGSAFGVFTSSSKHHFSIAFFRGSALEVQERRWATDQTITETDKGIILDFTSTQFDKVLQWVLSHGSAAQPMEPKALVTAWAKEIRAMAVFAEQQSFENRKSENSLSAFQALRQEMADYKNNKSGSSKRF